ncbi:MAG: peptide chain release factor N(5)-glutamine methyltransferase [Bacteroidales bacterium]|nr:peptide chain release factor N(5)-glutamine methyltransferase [Bacteroidales bacterium]MBQ7818745.1 peptide chain release factor N(5)-glutamine methyltransferase [Bacteroidales bacterium]
MKDSIKYISEKLSDTYDQRECKAIARYLVEEVSGMSYTDILVKDTNFSEEQRDKIDIIINRLIDGEPMQYVLGYSYFCNLKIGVKSGVLIPRPETEELCRLIIDREKTDNPKILDICTGSGCIALALKNGIPNALVYGVDISETALRIAKENSYNCNLEVNFFKYDVLNNTPSLCGGYDIIVSNPPYICNFEKDKMEDIVLKNEPHLALFVEDETPLVFYDKIAKLGVKILNNGGRLFFEINPLFYKELQELLKNLNYSDIEVIEDINGRQRFVACTKKRI